MAENIIITLGVSIAIFAIIKSFFGVLGWYSKDSQDKLYRENLDKIWLKIDGKSLFDFGHMFLIRLDKKIETSLKPKKEQIVLFFFILNFFFFYFAAIFADNTELSGRKFGIDFIDDIFAIPTLIFALLIAIFGTLIDSISFYITILLIKKAANSPDIFGITKHLFFDLTIALISTSLFFSGILLFEDGVFLDFQEQKLLIFSFVIGITSTLPSLTYLLIGIVLLFLWSIPIKIQKIVHMTIYKLTTDNSPVLTQLGNLIGGGIGVLGGIAAIIKILN